MKRISWFWHFATIYRDLLTLVCIRVVNFLSTLSYCYNSVWYCDKMISGKGWKWGDNHHPNHKLCAYKHSKTPIHMYIMAFNTNTMKDLINILQ
jgi:hypothetical protein